MVPVPCPLLETRGDFPPVFIFAIWSSSQNCGAAPPPPPRSCPHEASGSLSTRLHVFPPPTLGPRPFLGHRSPCCAKPHLAGAVPLQAPSGPAGWVHVPSRLPFSSRSQETCWVFQLFSFVLVIRIERGLPSSCAC